MMGEEEQKGDMEKATVNEEHTGKAAQVIGLSGIFSFPLSIDEFERPFAYPTTLVDVVIVHMKNRSDTCGLRCIMHLMRTSSVATG